MCTRAQVAIAVVVGLVAAGATSRAEASGFDAPNVGSQQSGVVTRDAAAVHYNPGQLGFSDRGDVQFGAGVIVGKIGYERERRGAYQFSDNLDFAEPIPAGDIDPSKTGTADGVSTVPVGPIGDVFVTLPAIPERLTFGFGLYVPYAAILSLPRDGAQRFQAQDVTLLSPHATLSAGVKLHDIISIGAGVSYVLTYMELSKVQDFGAVDVFADGLAAPPINQANDFGSQAPSTVRELDVLARQIEIEHGVSHGVSFNVGVALRPLDDLDIGLVYQHGSKVRANGKFTLDMDDDFFTQDLAAQGLQYPAVVQGDAHIELSLPKRVTAAVGYTVSEKLRLELMGSYVSYQDFNAIRIRLDSPDLAQPALGIGASVNQDLVRNWKPVGIVEATARIRPIDRLAVSVLAGYHSPASPDTTVDMASPDGHRLIFGAGAGWSFTERFSLYGDFEGQAIVPRRVTDSDFDLGNGRYDLFLAQVTVHGRVRFGPWGRGKRGASTSAPASPAEPAEDAPTGAGGSTDASTPAPAQTPATSPESGDAPAPSAPSGGPPPPPPPPPPTARRAG